MSEPRKQHRDAGCGGCAALSLALLAWLGIFVVDQTAGLVIGWIPLAVVLWLDWRSR